MNRMGSAGLRSAGKSHSVLAALLLSAAACFGLASVRHAGRLVGTVLSHRLGISADDWAGETEYRFCHVAWFGRFANGYFLGMGRTVRRPSGVADQSVCVGRILDRSVRSDEW